MAIQIVCPQCQSIYTVLDELRGKKARCKKCATSFVIETAPEAAPAELPKKRKHSEPMREQDEDDDNDRPRRTKPPRERKRASAIVPLAIVGGAIITVLALLGAGIGVWKYWQSRQADAAATALADRPRTNTTTSTTPSAPPKPFWHAALPLHEGKEIAGTQRPEFGNLPEQPVEEDGAEPPPRPMGKPKEIVASVGGQMAPDVLLKVKQATFYIRVVFADGRRGTGSAFLIDDAGTVVTNAHVLGMLEGGAKKPKQIEILVHSGERNEKKLHADFLSVDRGNDLALVRIPKEGLPEPLTVKTALDLVETQPLWVSGYPLGEGLGKNVTVTACPVSSLRRRNGELHTVQVQGDMMPGNSGGPVVDAAGNVVGVAVRILVRTKFNFAVPGDMVTRLVNGRYGDLDVGVPYHDAGAVKMVLTVRMEDALHRIRKVAVDLWTGDDGKVRPASTRAPRPRPNDGPRVTVDLPYDPKTTTAKAPALLLPLPPGKTYWLQPRFEDGRGNAHWASASPWKFPATVERKPALLVSKPNGQERSFRLKRSTTLTLDYTLHGVHEIDAALVTRFTESQHPGPGEGVTELRRQYTGLSLDVSYNRGKPQESSLPGQLASHLAKLGGKLRLDGDVRVVGDELKPNLAKEEESHRQHLSALHSLTQQTLDVVSIPLPGKTLQPGETWKPKAVRTVHPEAFELGQTQPVSLSASYLYTGTLSRNGREEAVCELLGEITPRGQEGGAEIGRISALLWIDLETGRVTRVEANWSVSFSALMGGYPMPARDTTEIVLEEDTAGK